MADTILPVSVLAQASGEEKPEKKPLTPAQEAGRKLKEAQMAKTTPEWRSKNASKAAKARWAKEKKKH